MLEIKESNPNIKVSRFLKCVQSEKSQKNIVLLLVKLAEHADMSSDISIPLKYYLDMYEELPEEPSFSEAGILLINSAVIYSKRVDSVHLNVERLIFSLLHAEQNQSQGCIANSPPQTIKKAKKRTLEKSDGRYGADMNIKRFKIISAYKRLDNSYLNIVKSSKLNCSPSLDKNCIHPTIWKYSAIEDYEYSDEIDSKKNYKLFNYHLEHRYNTLIPDINFKMYFKIKDFIIDKEREPWPPLSIAYIEQYVNLENIILRTEARNARIDNSQIRKDSSKINQIKSSDQEEMHTLSNITKQLKQMGNNISALSYKYSQINHTDTSCMYKTSLSEQNINDNNKNDYLSFDSMNLDINFENLKNKTTIQATIDKERNKNCNEENYYLSHFENNTFEMLSTRETSTDIDNCNTLRNTVKSTRDNITTHSKSNEDLTTVKVILPHLDDEGVFFFDLDEHDQQMLSPSVVATDVFRCVKNKQNIIVVVDDVIKNIYNIREPRQRLSLPVFCSFDHPILPINLFRIHNKYFRKRRTFKLDSEFNLLKKARLKKHCGNTKNSTCIRTHVCLSEDVVGVHHSPLASPSHESDFYGFSDDVSYDKNRTLSRDSGISVFQAKILSNQEINKADHFNSNNYLTQEPDDNTSNTNNYSFSKTSTINAGIINNENITTVASKVQEWHTHLQPILAKSRERHHFDVLELGTEIIRKFETYNTGNEIISLNDVMEEKDSSLISRYFLSTLLLANHGNITINIRRKCSENPSELIDVELQLLDKRRNFTCLNENIELSTSEVAEEIQITASTFKNFRILKPIPKTSKREDHDSGISISDGCSL